jgi:PAS domain S-box-containing protein
MITVLFAIENEEEQALFRDVIKRQNLEMTIVVPESVHSADHLVSSGATDIIVTDFHFQNGGFADWLFLWQHPFVILAEWDEYERLTALTTDQTSDFAIRDPDQRYMHYLPLVIRKVLNNKESMERHNIDLRMNEQRYRELVQALPDIVYSLDAEGRFIFINESVNQLGWDPVELIGKHFSTILNEQDVERVSRLHVLPRYLGKDTGPEAAPKLFDERRTGERRTRDLEVRLKHKVSVKGGDLRYGAAIAYGEVNAVGFTGDSATIYDPGTVGIIRDITSRIEIERLLRKSLDEKEILLAEIHHRVKNNLQVVSSLLNLHAGGIEHPEALERFTDAQMQIQSMALIHEQLYQSDHFDQMEIDTYIRRLVEHLLAAYGEDDGRITVVYDLEPTPITIKQAVPLALLLNELVSNSLKYAFPGEALGSIRINVHRTDPATVLLQVVDDGIGLPRKFDITVGGTLGHALIGGLASQLGGTIETDGSQGASFSIAFPLDTVQDVV